MDVSELKHTKDESATTAPVVETSSHSQDVAVSSSEPDEIQGAGKARQSTSPITVTSTDNNGVPYVTQLLEDERKKIMREVQSKKKFGN